ncbi:hypothetical protein [Leptospira paudalimensis]|uniref:Uncharacterized protein n=1 Tax=Leptospira paudalimensis TaxID=2950024 RepID=A0ABT3M683_9LEPT|nr:hypothetical protein [Leptospira paudalimensis]MCW7503907.1 hypothetical protein [Leptospira paudalimensis]
MSVTKDIIDGFSNIVKDKIGHPFLGSFIFTFLTVNYDLLIDLANNIEDPLAVMIFKNDLCGEWHRLTLPILALIFFPTLIKNGLDITYTYFREKTNTIIENRKESERKEIHLNKIDKLEESLGYSNQLKEDIINNSAQIITTSLNLLKNKSNIQYLHLFESTENLSNNDFVSLVKNINKIQSYNRRSTFVGRVHYKVNNRFYIVECFTNDMLNNFIFNLKEISEQKKSRVYISVNGSEFEFTDSDTGSSHIMAYKDLNTSKIKTLFSDDGIGDILNNQEPYIKNLFSITYPIKVVFNTTSQG